MVLEITTAAASGLAVGGAFGAYLGYRRGYAVAMLEMLSMSLGEIGKIGKR